MACDGKKEGNLWLYSGVIPFQASGQHGFAVRILPKNADLASPYEPGLICWGLCPVASARATDLFSREL